MVVTKETVADNMYVYDQTTIINATRALVNAYIGGHPTIEVSMSGANQAVLQGTVLNYVAPGTTSLEVFIEQSNDKGNWFFAGQITTAITGIGTFSVTASGVGMAYVRALFVWVDSAAQPTNVQAFLDAELTTALV